MRSSRCVVTCTSSPSRTSRSMRRWLRSTSRGRLITCRGILLTFSGSGSRRRALASVRSCAPSRRRRRRPPRSCVRPTLILRERADCCLRSRWSSWGSRRSNSPACTSPTRPNRLSRRRSRSAKRSLAASISSMSTKRRSRAHASTGLRMRSPVWAPRTQRAVLRQGRLKSAMLLLVGEQLKAYNEYVKKPFFQNRFRDQNGVVYTNPEEPVFDMASQVPQQYHASAVVVDAKTDKTTAPPGLLDLAGLSSRLSSKGVKADAILATYQKMYEDQVVSYPRTEDKNITTEQFNQMLPFVDKIAMAIGVDTALLIHRVARKTHVKDSGAHGANRPGPKVPTSLDEIGQKYGPTGKFIYEELARSFLAMFAEDYLYQLQTGHLQDYPSFKGRVSVPK